MSLGTGALQVGGGPEQCRHSREVSMATLQAGTAQPKTLQGAWREEEPADRDHNKLTPQKKFMQIRLRVD